MPREIVTADGISYRFREHVLPPLAADSVRIRTEFAAPKHGTEAHALTGSAFNNKRWDKDLRMFLPGDDAPPNTPPTEKTLGNMVVGIVTQVGADVTRYNVGDRVFGYGPIREEHQAPEHLWWPLGDLSNADAVCADPAHVALVAVRDGNIRVGDTVAVFGLGAIGLMAIQIARAGGAELVFGVDPLPLRRQAALQLGADAAFDPRNEDAGLAIKQATNNHGVDVSLETSGNGRALHEAIRCIRQCGTIVHVPWGPTDASALRLDEEFHLNRPTIIGSQAWSGWGNPDRSYPLWDHDRAYAAAISLLRRGQITGEPVVTPVVPFEDAPGALPDMLAHPENSIKFGIRFAANPAR